MVVLAFLILWEAALPLLPASGLPDSAVAGMLAFTLWGIAFLGAYDVTSSFMGRMAMGFAMAWYLGSIKRWIPAVDQVYTDAGEGVSLLLAMSFLVLAPMGLLLTATLSAWLKWREYRHQD